jgi:hypothetical protein
MNVVGSAKGLLVFTKKNGTAWLAFFFLRGFGKDLPEKAMLMVHGKSGSSSTDAVLESSCPDATHRHKTHLRVSVGQPVGRKVASAFDEPVLAQGESVGCCLRALLLTVFLAPSPH